MKTLSTALLLCGIAMGGIGVAAPAQAGCLTGAAVGGVVGHMAGHHAILGAAAGCAIAHHHDTVVRRNEDRNDSDRQMYGSDAYRN